VVLTVAGNDHDVFLISDGATNAVVRHIVISDGDSDTVVPEAVSRSVESHAVDSTAAAGVSLSDTFNQGAGAAASAPAPAGMRATDDGGGARKHLQTVADVLCASALAASFGLSPAPVGGMELVRVPLELTYSLPDSTSGPTA